MIRVGIIGATGYAGGELVRILLNHKDAKIVWYGSRSYIDKKYYQVYQNMFQLVEDICKDDNLEELAKPDGSEFGIEACNGFAHFYLKRFYSLVDLICHIKFVLLLSLGLAPEVS